MPRTLATFALFFLLTAPAYAGDNGEGILGETDDKLVTLLSLGVVVLIALIVIAGSTLQGALEKRKEARKAVELRKRVGW